MPMPSPSELFVHPLVITFTYLPFFSIFSPFLSAPFPPFLSFFPPLSISRCPAFSARFFSVRAVRPDVCFCAALASLLSIQPPTTSCSRNAHLGQFLLLYQLRLLRRNDTGAALCALAAMVSDFADKSCFVWTRGTSW